MDFVAIDFETANYERDSACSIGWAVVRNDAVVSNGVRLIRPPYRHFEYRFTELHGLTWEDVATAPTFGDLWPELHELLEGQMLAAHNAPFDMGVLAALLDRYRLRSPKSSYFCTCVLARRAWPELPNHKLGTVARHLGIPLNHHQAESDAVACARIAIAANVALAAVGPPVKTTSVARRRGRK